MSKAGVLLFSIQCLLLLPLCMEFGFEFLLSNVVLPVLSRPEVIKPFSCSTQLSRTFQLLIKTKNAAKDFNCIQLSDVFIMPTIVGILTFMSGINFVLS